MRTLRLGSVAGLVVLLGGLGFMVALPRLASANPQAVRPSWNGTWTESVAGDPHGYIYLKESGSSAGVTGHYTFCNGKIHGTNHSGVLTGTWTQSWPCGNARKGSGRFAFRLTSKGNEFMGTWGYGSSATDSKPVADTWTGRLQSLQVPGSPPVKVGPWSGGWNETVSGGPLGTLYLIQRANDSSVYGYYPFCNGQINGTDHKGVLTGTWTQAWPCGGAKKGSGRVDFTLNSKGIEFTGTWGYGSSATNSQPSKNTWTGRLQSR
jgi:hypothetical protein